VVGRPSAEEMSRDYQFSAHIASVCCIATGAHERGQLWVNIDKTRTEHNRSAYSPIADIGADMLERPSRGNSGHLGRRE